MTLGTTKLYTLRFKHYAQRGSQEGILGILEAETDEQVLKWLEDNRFFDGEEYEEDEPTCFDVTQKYLASNPELPIRAAELGMERSDNAVWEGTKRQVAILSRSTEDEDWDDLYYGKTVVWWEEGSDNQEGIVEILTELGLIL